MNNKIVVIIGYGRFGRLMAELLLNHTSYSIVAISSRQHASDSKRLAFYSFSDQASILTKADVVIPCVPISKFEETINTIAPLVKKDSLVMDVCSVKMLPVSVMKKHLPKTVQILGTHPLFGWDSMAMNNGLKNLRVVLVRERVRPAVYAEWMKIWQNMELTVVEMTAEEHDRHAAHSHAYSFLIGKIGELMKIKPTPIDTLGFHYLYQLQETVVRDSEQLFLDMQRYNPFAKEMRQKFSSVILSLESDLKKEMLRK